MLAPVPAAVAPQLPVYHLKAAPVPSTPPLTLSVLLLPGATADGVAVTVTGAVEFVFRFTVTVGDNCVAQVVPVRVANTLNVVAALRFPVGKLIVVLGPDGVTGLPTGMLPALFLSWYSIPTSAFAI